MKHFRQQAGDTIVEVMIVLAILGLAIGISYATANQSLKANRQALETSGAVGVLQQQIEAIQAMYATNPDKFSTVGATDYFCIPPGSYTMSVISTGGGPPPIPSTYAPRCLINSLYYVYVNYNTAAPANGTFTVKAQWYDFAGQGIDSSTMVYKVN